MIEKQIPFRDAYKIVMENDIFDINEIALLVKERKSLGSPGNY